VTTAIPYNLKPKATKLAEGPDDSLEPSVTPTDAERRGIPPIFWAAMDKSKGGTAPPDAPLAPPPTDPAHRTVAPLVWPRVIDRNRPMRELAIPVPDLDPDIALWPVTIVSRWPFAGHPSEGIWPKGWLGVDNTATVWVCTVAGEPGTWEALAVAGGGSFPTYTGSGSPQGVVSAAAIGNTYQDTVRGGIWVAGGTGNNHWAQVGGRDPATGALIAGFYVDAPANAGAWVIADPSASAALSDVASQNNLTGSGNGVFWNAGASDGSQSLQVVVGPPGSPIQLFFTQAGVLNVPAALILSGIPTSDPAVTDEVWNSNGILVMSGTSAPPFGDTGWVDASGLLTLSWAVTGGGICQYRRLNGVTYVQARITASGGASNPAFTLPAGFRPGHAWVAPVNSPTGGTPGAGLVSVATNGALSFTNQAGTPAAGSFDAVLAFPADA
jgi:hypothetical protein